jgi:hypothetical protein
LKRYEIFVAYNFNNALKYRVQKKEEYDDINYLLTIIGFSIYKSYYVSNQS